MRLTLLILAALLATTGITFIAPHASAVAVCVDNSPALVQDCSYYLVCIGRSTSYGGGESCQIGIDYPCRYCKPLD